MQSGVTRGSHMKMRSVLAVLTGAVIWAILWLGLNQALITFAPGTFAVEPITSTGGLLGLWASCLVISVLAGYLTAIVARKEEVRHASILGVLQLGLGIFFQLQYWELMPLWYHTLFLLSLFPAHAYGGVLRRGRLVLSPAV